MNRYEAKKEIISKIKLGGKIGDITLVIDKIYDYFENQDKTTFKDYTFTNCNDCKNKINNKFTLICSKCKRFYGCYFERKKDV